MEFIHKSLLSTVPKAYVFLKKSNFSSIMAKDPQTETHVHKAIWVTRPHQPAGWGRESKEEINGPHDWFQLRPKSWRTIIGFIPCLFLQYFRNCQKEGCVTKLKRKLKVGFLGKWCLFLKTSCLTYLKQDKALKIILGEIINHKISKVIVWKTVQCTFPKHTHLYIFQSSDIL